MLLATVSVLLWSNVTMGEIFTFHHEQVLGTSLEIRAVADSAQHAAAAEAAVLEEIERLRAIFSTYDSTSELSRWQQRRGTYTLISGELTEVLRLCQHWQAASGGAFHPATPTLASLWRACASQNRPPTPHELQAAVAALNKPLWQLDSAAGSGAFLAGVPLSLDALAKGYIIDRACQAAWRPEAGIDGILVNIGGDLRVCGQISLHVAIADPRRSGENDPPMESVRLQAQALATSGGYRRGFELNGRWHSHIFDPRNGRPADHIASASIIAPTAAEADALATTVCVLTPAESLHLIAGVPGASCLVIESDGQLHRSDNWPSERSALPIAQTADSSGFELAIKFEIARPDTTPYMQPYVAIWIENAEGFPVRTLLLWVKTSGSGATWVPDLKRWYRGDLKRLMTADKRDFVATRSGATRPPGKYDVVWDGKDNTGKALTRGEYTVMIEAAREHGTYQLIRQKVTLSDAPFDQALPGNIEIKAASLEYSPGKTSQ